MLVDLIASGRAPVARLTEIFRQASESRIIVNAHRVNRGAMPELAAPGTETSDFYFVEAADPEDAAAKIVKVVAERIPTRFGLNPIRDVQVLCPMNRGGAGARSLNLDLQAALNPEHSERPAIERFGFTYRVGDKVMQITNNYEKETFNGDIGFITAIDAKESFTIDFDGRPVLLRSENSMRSCWRTRRPFTSRRAPNIQRWSFPSSPSTTLCCAPSAVYRHDTRQTIGGPRRQKKAIAIAVRGTRGRRRSSKLKELLVMGDTEFTTRGHT